MLPNPLSKQMSVTDTGVSRSSRAAWLVRSSTT